MKVTVLSLKHLNCLSAICLVAWCVHCACVHAKDVHSHSKGDLVKTGALSFSSTMVKVHTIVLDKGVVPESLTV